MRANLSAEIARLEALLREGQHPDVCAQLADAYVRAGRSGDAVALAESLLADDQYTDALTVIETAMSRSGEDDALRRLMQRALDGQAGEQTRVHARSPTDAQRPDASPPPVAQPPLVPPDSAQTPLPGEATMVAPMPSAAEMVGGLVQSPTSESGPKWKRLNEEWQDAFDTAGAKTSSPVSDPPEPMVAAPPAMDLNLPPLPDPMAVGMPPLPEEDAWPRVRAERLRADDDRADTLAAQFDDSTKPMLETALSRAQTDSMWAESFGDRPAAMGHAETLPASAEANPQTAEADALFTDDGQADTPSVPPPAGLAAMPTAPSTEGRLTATIPSATAMDPDGVEVPTGDSEQAEQNVPPPRNGLAPKRRRRPGPAGWGIAIGALAVLLAMGGVVWWFVQGSTRVRQAQKVVDVAKVSATGPALERAVKVGTKALEQQQAIRIGKIVLRGAGSVVLAEEVDLLRALLWLVHGEGDAPVEGAAGKRWAQHAQRAIVALGNNRGAAARAELHEAMAEQKSDRALHAALLAWAAWIDGKPADALQWARQALEIDASTSVAWLVSGHVLLELDQLDQAQKAYEAVLREHPSHLPAALGLAAARLRSGERDGRLAGLLDVRKNSSVLIAAWQGLLRADLKLQDGRLQADELVTRVEQAPPRREMLTHGVRVLIRLCRFDVARAAVERLRAPKADGASGEVGLLRAELAVAEGREARALELLGDGTLPSEHYRRLRAVAAAYAGKSLFGAKMVAEGAPTPTAQLAQALGHARAGHHAKALAEARALWSSPEASLRAHVLVGQIALKQGKLKQAAQAAGAALQQCAAFLPAVQLVARVRLAVGAYEPALAGLQRAHKGGHRTVAGLLDLARAHAALGWVEQAKADVAAAVQQGGSAEQLRLARAEIALAERQPERVLRQLGPEGGDKESPDVLLLRVRALVAIESFPEAEEALLQADERWPDHPWPDLLLGQLLVRQQSPEAQAHLERVVAHGGALGPILVRVLAGAHLSIADIWRQGRHGLRHKALPQLVAAVEADPDFASAWLELGRFHLRDRRPADAREALARSIELHPNQAMAYYLLGRAAVDDAAAARRAFERFLELQPKGKRARDARRLLRALASGP